MTASHPRSRAACSQGYRGRYAALKDAVTETEVAFDDARLADVPLVDLLTEPVYVLAEQLARRGTDAGRGRDGPGGDRPVPPRACSAAPGSPERLFSEEERAYAFRHRDPAPRLAARFAAKEAVMKALGVGLGDVRAPRRRGRPPRAAVHRWSRSTGGRPRWPTSAASREWQLSLTHTDLIAMAVAIALG